jgi:regulator of sirC expression with transglutaminase-like and TPR domain
VRRSLAFLFLALPLAAFPSHPLFQTLNPRSVIQQLAFYELYPDTEEGQKAWQQAWKLLSEGCTRESGVCLVPPAKGFPLVDIRAIISLVTQRSSQTSVPLTLEQLSLLQELGKQLPNRKLPGAHVWTKEEVLALPAEQIDLARGLLINQFDTDPDAKKKIMQYEATLDLMALEIRAMLPLQATPVQKIDAINQFIFEEMRFRFPPHSLYAKDIDLYTFLPAVLDSREGVCLGVSILYLCLAQRLDLELEIITPPGHIYLRHNNGLQHLNIETTARGIDLPSETYLGINTRSLQQRNLKEVIGQAFINQASVAWELGNHKETVALYEKALSFLPQDPLLKLFLGLNYLFIGATDKGRKQLEPLRNFTFSYAVSPETIADDYLQGRIDIEGIKNVFLHVDETRDSILKKQAKLRETLKRYPRFRAGLFQLAITWLQLGRTAEAMEILEQYHQLDPRDATIEYYLAIVLLDRMDYPRAWTHFNTAEKILNSRDHRHKALQQMRLHLLRFSPPPSSLTPAPK